MDDLKSHIVQLEAEIAELEIQLLESKSIIEAIQEGSIDALVLNNDGEHSIYTLESADYTYRILIEKVQEGAVSISETGLILYCNQYFADLLHVPSNEIIGTYFHDYLDSVDAFLLTRQNLTLGFGKGEIILKINDIKLPVYISLTDLSPFIPAIGIIVTDLTQKKKHEQDLTNYRRALEVKVAQLNRKNAELVEFVHVISHDIKEPLRKIVAYSSYLVEESREKLTEREIRLLSVVGNSATRLTSLVDDLVKYSTHDRAATYEPVDLNIVLQEVIDDMEMDVADKKAIIDIENLPVISGSIVQIRQLFLNMLTNALKFQKENTAPIVKISPSIHANIDPDIPDKKFHCISIHDNGIGIEEDQIAKIFMIFKRLHTREAYPGNGVGLSICKKIIENHEGHIKVVSTFGQGTTFNLYFPAANHEESTYTYSRR